MILTLLATSNGWAGIEKLNMQPAEIPVKILWHEGEVNYAEFSPDGSKIVTASSDKYARIWDSDGNILHILRGHGYEKKVVHAAFSQDSQQVVTSSYDGTARVWDVQTGQLLQTLKHEKILKNTDESETRKRIVINAAFPSANKYIITLSTVIAGMGGRLNTHLWDIQKGQLLQNIETYRSLGNTNIIKIHPNDRELIIVPNEKQAEVWNIQTKQRLQILTHEDTILHAEFSPDGTKIITASFDKEARLWDA